MYCESEIGKGKRKREREGERYRKTRGRQSEMVRRKRRIGGDKREDCEEREGG